MEDINEIKERYSQEAADAAGEGKQKISEAASAVKVRSQEYWENTKELIRSNPGTAIGVALISGLALGAIAGSRLGSNSTMEENLSQAEFGPVAEKASTAWSDAKESFSKTLSGLRCMLDEAIQKLES